MGLSKKAVETLRKNIYQRHPRFLLQFLEYEKMSRVGRRYDYILAFPTAGGHAGGPFGWCLVLGKFNARR